MSPVQDLTIREAGALLRSGALSAEELTEGILARIAATEPVVHAYVQVFGDEALAAARTVDVELRAGRDRGPLHGIPIAIKDFFDVAGTVTGCGSRVRDDAPAAESDAEAIARLRDAGALVVGKTVTHEFAAGVLSPPVRTRGTRAASRAVVPAARQRRGPAPASARSAATPRAASGSRRRSPGSSGSSRPAGG